MKIDFSRITLNHEKLRRSGVGALIVFGSYVEGTAHPGSDIDVGVVFEDQNPLKTDPVEVYGLLHEELSEKISENIDIVYLHETPLSLQFNAVTEGVPIFYTSEEFYYDYKERIIKLYLDFRFFENIFDEAVLEG
jgi:predicted nucleotidyltransferase